VCAIDIKNLEIGQKILIGQGLSEIPPNPPLIKGGWGDFWQDRGEKKKSYPLVSFAHLGITPEN
jgi:hypothetical protein